MAAIHGREDELLEAARFARLLRQANDAEVADVRTVGEDEYEISPHRTGAAAPAKSQSLPAATPTSPAGSESAASPATRAAPVRAEPAPENGKRFGVRFRRGSRSTLRAGDVPLIGVVEVDTPAPSPQAEAEPMESAASPADTKKPARPRRAPRKKAAAKTAVAEAPAPPDVEPSPPKRPGARPRKKAE